MKNRLIYLIITLLLIITVYRFYGLYYVYILLLFLALNGYLINRQRIKKTIIKNYGREETTDKLLNQSAGKFYLAVDPENPQELNKNDNMAIPDRPCPNCGADLIVGLSYCEECGFRLEST